MKRLKKDAIIKIAYSGRLNEAIQFASKRHGVQLRKGTKTPYIVHPLETMTILSQMNAAPEVLVAGVLHDVVRMTATSIEEIREQFDDDVADLVFEAYEDENMTWQQLKEKEYQNACTAPPKVKKLILADMLSNMRILYNEYRILGDLLWEHLDEDARQLAWYYGIMTDALATLQHDCDCSEFYWELVSLYKDVFVIFSLDAYGGIIYQENIAGEKYVLHKGNPQWFDFDAQTPEHAILINRKYAERIEDNWNDPGLEDMLQDMLDAAVPGITQ